MVKDKTLGILAAATIYFIFGINVVVCKDLLNCGAASPAVLLEIRLAGAAILFWLASFSSAGKGIEKKDLPKLFLASLLGMTIPQSASMFGLSMSTPIDASMINSLKPVFAIFASLLLFGERQNARTRFGVIMAVCGVLLLIVSGGNLDSAFKTSPAGVLVLCLNGLSFAFYLAIFKPLVRKYHPLTFMKWIMLFSAVCLLPIALKDLPSVNLETMTPSRYLELAFLVVMATFICYLLSPIAQKRLSPTQYCIVSYVQPLAALLISITVGYDIMTLPKVIAVVMVLAGAYLTTCHEKNSSTE